MGNICKTDLKASKVFEPSADRILYKTVDSNQGNISELQHDVISTKSKCFSTSHDGDKNKCPPHTPMMSMTEFIEICARNRPSEITDSVWDKFVSSICFEFFWLDVQAEADKKRQGESKTSSRSSCQLSIEDVMEEEASGRSTPTASDSSVKFAGKFVFAESDSDNVDAVSKSLSSLSASSTTNTPDTSLAIYYADNSIDEKTSDGYSKKLNVKYALSLRDIHDIKSEVQG